MTGWLGHLQQEGCMFDSERCGFGMTSMCLGSCAPVSTQCGYMCFQSWAQDMEDEEESNVEDKFANGYNGGVT